MSADITVLVPMLGRPHRVEPLLASLQTTAPDARVLFCLSPHDPGVHKEVERLGKPYITVAWVSRGDYARKINAGYRHTSTRYLFTGADDLLFHPGWWQAALGCLQQNPHAGVVGTNDLGNPRVLRGEHATHFLVTRDYADKHGAIDQPGAIFHEGYLHEYVDDELVCTAKRRGAWIFCEQSIVEHLHPDWGKAPTDRMYAQQRLRMRQGAQVFRMRRRLWT